MYSTAPAPAVKGSLIQGVFSEIRGCEPCTYSNL